MFLVVSLVFLGLGGRFDGRGRALVPRCRRRFPPFRAGRSFGIVLAILGLLVVFGFLVASLGFFILALRLLVFVFVFVFVFVLVLVLFLVLVFVPSRAALLVPLPTILQRPSIYSKFNSIFLKKLPP